MGTSTGRSFFSKPISANGVDGSVVESGSEPIGDNRTDSTIDAIDTGTGNPGIERGEFPVAGSEPTGTDNGNPAPRKRGRPPGSGSKNTGSATQKKASGNLGLQGPLFTIHLMLAALIEAPEFAITEEQAKDMSKAISAVSDGYMDNLDPKMVAWGNLALVFGATYGSAFMKMNARKKKEAALNRRGNITPLNSANG
jgi:hypothetical protein